MESYKLLDAEGGEDGSTFLLSTPHSHYHDHNPRRFYGQQRNVSASFRWCPRFTLKSIYLSLIVIVLFIILTYNSNDYYHNGLFMPGSVAGWSYNTSRDTRQYVLSENATPLHRPKDICSQQSTQKIFLLIVVCSSMENFHARMAIRETWGNITNYEILGAKIENVTKYGDKIPSADIAYYSNFSIDSSRMKRDILEYDVDEDGDSSVDDPRFQMSRTLVPTTTTLESKEIETVDNSVFDYDYQTEISNIMRIPARGETKRSSGENEELDSIKKMLRLSIKDDKIQLTFDENDEKPSSSVKSSSFKFGDNSYRVKAGGDKVRFVFLLGQASGESNDTSLQSKIDRESALYGDILQESFVDSYNNLTLKSVMLLKWASNDCADTVKYVMKTDDDMFINLPRLVTALEDQEKKNTNKLLMGSLICHARPISDTTSKWYSPRYMFKGKVYPKYLSGTGYVMSISTAVDLYRVALDTPLFHIEDVYITGICSRRAGIRPIDNPGFSYLPRSWDICSYYKAITAHQVTPMKLRRVYSALMYAPLPLLAHCNKNSSTVTHHKKKSKKAVCI